MLRRNARPTPCFSIGLTAAALGAIVAAGCTDPASPDFGAPREPIRQLIRSVDLAATDFLIEIDLENPQEGSLRVRPFSYELMIAGQPYLRGEHSVELRIPGGAVRTAAIPIRIRYRALYARYSNLAEEPAAEYELHADPGAPVAGRRYADAPANNGARSGGPIRYQNRFPILKPPYIRVGDTDFDNDGWTSAKVKMDVRIENPNIFPLGVEDLGYDLVMGSTPIGRLTASSNDPIGARSSGHVELRGKITARHVLGRLLAGGGLDSAKVYPHGAIRTPWNRVTLDPAELREMFERD